MKECPLIEKFNKEQEEFLKNMKKRVLVKDGKKISELECTCGANSTKNNNLHAFHCDLKK